MLQAMERLVSQLWLLLAAQRGRGALPVELVSGQLLAARLEQGSFFNFAELVTAQSCQLPLSFIWPDSTCLWEMPATSAPDVSTKEL